MTLESLESMAVTDKKRFAGIPSWIFTKLSSLWVLFFFSKPHDHGNDRPKPVRPPPISDPSDIEAFGTPIACPSQQTSPVNQPQILNPIVQLFRDREMGKTALGFVIPMTTFLLSVYSKESPPILMQLTLMSLCIGLAALWNGILLRETFPRVANAIEQLGAACILLAVFWDSGIPSNSLEPPSHVEKGPIEAIEIDGNSNNNSNSNSIGANSPVLNLSPQRENIHDTDENLTHKKLTLKWNKRTIIMAYSTVLALLSTTFVKYRGTFIPEIFVEHPASYVMFLLILMVVFFLAIIGVIFEEHSPPIGKACNLVAPIGAILLFIVLFSVLLPPSFSLVAWPFFGFALGALIY
ncbi:hypothetical protein F0562_033946 [Nyssa sinensis]|uniref:Uncharacterized protein n=1 Tax=Nyssa sinensis TaxID=561372 RepID=A0A5J5AE07_9ASTE|nr:hypothetical protein F0562_033946 [Nyssa sinensis]